MVTRTIGAGDVGKHAVTLTANTVETFVFTDNVGAVQVVSDGVAAVYFTTDGSEPTVAGDNCYLLPAGTMAVDDRVTSNSPRDVVKVISSGTPTVSVMRA